MKAALRYVDGFIRGRAELIERVKRGENLGRFIAGAAVMYLVFTAIYGLAMGSFRWVHPEFFFSDFVIDGRPPDGPAPAAADRPRSRWSWSKPAKPPSSKGEEPQVVGMVDKMNADESSFTTTHVAASPELVGRTIRFNRTNPTPPYEIVNVEQLGPYCRIEVKGPPMVAEAPWQFTLLAALKVPALFLVTLLVCLPVLYVLNVAVGWKLRFAPTAAVLIFSLAGTSVMLAVFAPIVAFFALLTDHYHFMMVLHVLVFIVAGAYGVQTLAVGLSGLGREDEAEQGLAKRMFVRFLLGRLIFVWLLLYMFVGCQMAWSLRPFVGTPYLIEFEALRPRSSNFYVNVIGSMGKLGDTRR